ncbi:hypothetical protein [Cerasicoccus maritimus]|uniref:hypothetical protein n=1 Tax=Cerasicoccus maritimus TaxID=490089 RepID=UPI0028526ADE|nr:hypothetical protein [Cerasicoccus maritimus]
MQALGIEDPVTLVAPAIQKIIDSIDGRGFGDKPVMISEIGAEALYGWRDMYEVFFSEQ